MTKPVYLTSLGVFFPGEPVSNDAMEDYLGRIHGRDSRLRARVLARNGIQTRHYAIDRKQQSRYRNSEMAALAVRHALERAGHELDDVGFLAAATTQADLPVPGFASMVHGELGSGPIEVATLHGVCGSGVAALQSAFLQVTAGEKDVAVACASEFPSRLFKASRYEAQECCEGGTSFASEFLRWMLSDGAGAAVLAPEPAPQGLSLRIDWIDLRSYAGQFPVCMVAGANVGADGQLGPGWLDYPSFEAAATCGALNLKQDVRMLDDVVKLGVRRFFELADERAFDPDALDWVVCHYSSEFFRPRIFELLRSRGMCVREDRWFSNLATRGNVGSASSFVLLDGLVQSGRLQPGQSVLLMVPESGRSFLGFVHMTAVGPAPKEEDALVKELARELGAIYREFERELRDVPIVSRLMGPAPDLDDYRTFLYQLRQQVVDGARWIARAASSLDTRALELRSLVLGHAGEEHRDYEMLERDYVAVGGARDAIRAGRKNCGSEALSAWMFHRASQPNPLGLLGAMFIIEGTGRMLAGQLSRHLSERLGLGPEKQSFLRHHAQADGRHMGKLASVLHSGILTRELADDIARTARVTGRLYRLQLEEMG